MKKKIVVASKNPVKIKAVELGFSRMFPQQQFEFIGVSVPSGVADQPMTDEETYLGAYNRANNAQDMMPDADFWFGLEGGLEDIMGEKHAFAWIVCYKNNGLMGKARTGTFALPPKVVELVEQGKELGEADDIVFGKSNSKQNLGAVGLLTKGVVDRAYYYADAVTLALIPFLNEYLYLPKDY